MIIRAQPGETVRTSDKAIESPGRDFHSGQAWWEDGERRLSLPDGFRRQAGSGTLRNTLDGQVVHQDCAFFGSKADRATMGNHPSFRDAVTVSDEERQILISLFESTDGKHWKNNAGWLGPAGSECTWYGVQCRFGLYGVTAVERLALGDNRLVGAIPESIGGLSNLVTFDIAGNRLSGTLPNTLIQRWLARKLYVSAEDSLLTNVSEIDFESSAPALLCEKQRITIRSDGRAILYTKRCRNATPKDRTTFCEVKKGSIGSHFFAQFAWLLERSGFYALQPDYSRNITDSGLETMRVTRDGKRYQVSDYAGAGPFELWVIERVVENVLSSAEWDSVTKIGRCPSLN